MEFFFSQSMHKKQSRLQWYSAWDGVWHECKFTLEDMVIYFYPGRRLGQLKTLHILCKKFILKLTSLKHPSTISPLMRQHTVDETGSKSIIVFLSQLESSKACSALTHNTSPKLHNSYNSSTDNVWCLLISYFTPNSLNSGTSTIKSFSSLKKYAWRQCEWKNKNVHFSERRNETFDLL